MAKVEIIVFTSDTTNFLIKPLKLFFKAEKIIFGLLMAKSLKLKVPESHINKGFIEPTTAAKIKYFRTLMQTQGLFTSNTQIPKSNVISKIFREAGNKMFIKGLKIKVHV